MNKMRFCTALPFMVAVLALAQNPSTSRVVNLKASDGTLLKASFLPRQNRVQAFCCSIKATGPVILGMMWRSNWQQLVSIP